MKRRRQGGDRGGNKVLVEGFSSKGLVQWYKRRRRSALWTNGPGGVRCPYFFPLGWQVTLVSSYVRRPFPSKEIRRISERDDAGPPVVLPGGQGIGLGSVWDPVVTVGQGIGLGSRTLERAGR